jgi:ABC-type dipeptide/oligopeptide/nickel transport system permease component
MLKYIIRRTLLIIPILLAVIFIVSFIMELTPGTPGRVLLGPVATQEEVDKLDQKLGTDRPFLER